MGQQNPTAPSHVPPNLKQLEQYVATIFTHQHEKINLQTLHQAISAILDNLRMRIPAEMILGKMEINLIMLRIFYQSGFVSTILKLLSLLAQKLQELNNRNFLLVKRHEFIFLLNLTNFILFFTDEKLAETMHSLTFRKDLTQETFIYIYNLENKDLRFRPHKNFLDNLTPTQADQMHEIVQNVLMKLITSRNLILTRSSLTFEIISQFQPCLFILFVKLVKSTFHSKNFSAKIRKGNSLKQHLRICQYFLGQGADMCRSSIYEPAVMLFITLIDKNTKNLHQIDSQLEPVPSHLFKKIPISLNNTFYHFTAIACLFSLAYKKEGSEISMRFSFNRIPTLILLNSLISDKKVTSTQMTDLLEKICLQTKIGSIERGFMTLIIERYNKLIKQKIKENKRIEQVKRTTSGFANKFLQKVKSSKIVQKSSQSISSYTTEIYPSQILQTYLISGAQPYSIKFESRRYLIAPEMVVQQFERNEQITQNQLKALNQRFTYESILNRKVIYHHIESYQWVTILPRIIKNHNLFGQEIKEEGMGRSKTVVGAMPVIRQLYIGNERQSTKSEKYNGESLMKVSKTKEKLSYLETQAAQNIYQKTSEDQKQEDFKRELKDIKMVRQQTESQKEEKAKNSNHQVSLVFEEEENGQIEENNDEGFQTSELELNNGQRKRRQAKNQNFEEMVEK